MLYSTFKLASDRSKLMPSTHLLAKNNGGDFHLILYIYYWIKFNIILFISLLFLFYFIKSQEKQYFLSNFKWFALHAFKMYKF